METVKIIFKGGAELEAEKSGSCYITNKKPTFPQDPFFVTISGEDGDIVIENAQLVECASIDSRYWFTFVEVSPLDLWKASIEDALCELSMG